MSPARGIWEVARREVVERWRSRAMRISFAIVVVVVAGAAVSAARIGSGTPTDDFGLVGPRAVALAPALRLEGRAAGREVRLHRLPDAGAARRAVGSGDVDVALVGGRLVVRRSPTGAAVRVAQRAVIAQRTLARLEAAGLTQAEAVHALTPRPLTVDVLEPLARDAERNRDVLMLGLFILYMALILYAQSVATSVTEEKASRVVELLLTSVPPRQLLAGKVLGVGTLGVAQLAVVGAVGLAAGRIAGGAGLPPGAPATVALVLAWFVLGFAFYSVAFAALGALVSRQEDLPAAIVPATLVMAASYIAALVALDDPNGTWAQIGALLPPFAPMIVPTRVVLGDMGAAGLAAAVAIEVLATFLLVLLAARIYERAILHIGAPVSLRRAVRGDTAGRAAPVAGGSRRLLGWAAVPALVGGVVLLETIPPLGIALLAVGVLLSVASRGGRHHPPRASA